MTPEQFCYWLQGYFEVHGVTCVSPDERELNSQQVQVIIDHLKTVFHKVTPDREVQDVLKYNPPIYYNPHTDPFKRPPDKPYEVIC